MVDISLTPGKPRGLISTILLTIVGSSIAGFLWIGRPGLAFLSFGTGLMLVFATAWYGFPLSDSVGWDTREAATLSAIIAWVLLVLMFRKSSTPTKWHSRWYSVLLLSFVTTLTSAVFIRSLLVQPFSTPAGSMAPTLLEGDYFFVSKSAYGFSRHSFPFDLIEFPGRIWAYQPVRGDVVALRSSIGVHFVKRLVGFPGETIRMTNGVLSIDGTPVDLRDEGKGDFDTGSEVGRLMRETLPNGVSYEIIDLQPDSISDNTEDFLVPNGHYFVLGDNRDNSSDSRFSLGFVTFEQLIGRAERIFWNSADTPFKTRQNLRPHP